MKLRSLNSGFTLVELMIVVALSSVLLLGVTMIFSSVKGMLISSNNLENSQEVLRYTSQTFRRSVKQTGQYPVIISSSSIQFQQDANTVACTGLSPVNSYTEIYSLVNNSIKCDIGDGNGLRTILTGIENINYSLSGELLNITVSPEGLPENYSGGVLINFALTRIILTNALQ